jgi:hypothetical protein
MSGVTKPSPPIRLVFQLERDEDPAVYDDLMRFTKGVKRVNRLRLLAHDGLFAQLTWLWGEPSASSPALARSAGGGRVTNDVFGPSVD